MRATHTQTNFTGGVLTGKMAARSDISKYGNGAEQLDNAIVFPQGGASKRPGTRFVARVRGDSPGRLLRFQFNDEESYAIEMTAGFFRFYRDGGQVTTTLSVSSLGVDSGTIYLATTASPHNLAVGDVVSIAGATPSGYDGSYAVLTAPSTTTVTIDIGSNPGSYTGGTGTMTLPYSVSHPYAESDLDGVRYTQSADILYLVHPHYIPRVLSRTGADVFSVASFQYEGGPMGSTEPAAITITNSGGSYGVGDTVTMTADSALWDHSGGSDLGRIVRMQKGSSWGYGIITSTTSTTVASLYVQAAVVAGAADAYQLGYWGGAVDHAASATTTLTNEGTSASSFPSAVTFHQQRLWFSNVPGHTQLMTASRVGEYAEFRPASSDGTVLDTDGLAYTIATNEVNAVYWMRSSAKGLMVGTVGEEHMIQSGSAFDPITPTNVRAEVQTSHGSKGTVRPLQVGSVVLFVQRVGEKLREFVFQFEQDQYVSVDLTLLAEEFGKKGVRYMAYQEEPSSIVWCVCDDGDVLAMTYQRDQEVVAWTKCDFSGGLAESVETTAEATDDAVWFIVNRTIDGSTARYIEALEPQFDVGDDQDLCWFVDSGLSYDGVNTDASDTLTATGASYAEDDSVTLTATGHTPFAGTSADVGRRFRLYDGDSIFDLEITAANTTASCTAKVLTDLPASLQATATASWAALTDSVSGLSHLEGESVSILLDGGTHPAKDVSSGAISLDVHGAKIVVGLGYTFTLKTLPIRTVQFPVDARGKISSVYSCRARFWNSLGGTFETSGGKQYVFPERVRADPLGRAPRVRSSSVDVRLGGTYDGIPSVTISSSTPLPFTLLGMTYELDINDAV